VVSLEPQTLKLEGRSLSTSCRAASAVPRLIGTMTVTRGPGCPLGPESSEQFGELAELISCGAERTARLLRQPGTRPLGR
jgi:hypothetical protein